jgi:hypothetical protein
VRAVRGGGRKRRVRGPFGAWLDVFLRREGERRARLGSGADLDVCGWPTREASHSSRDRGRVRRYAASGRKTSHAVHNVAPDRRSTGISTFCTHPPADPARPTGPAALNAAVDVHRRRRTHDTRSHHRGDASRQAPTSQRLCTNSAPIHACPAETWPRHRRFASCAPPRSRPLFPSRPPPYHSWPRSWCRWRSPPPPWLSDGCGRSQARSRARSHTHARRRSRPERIAVPTLPRARARRSAPPAPAPSYTPVRSPARAAS